MTDFTPAHYRYLATPRIPRRFTRGSFQCYWGFCLFNRCLLEGVAWTLGAVASRVGEVFAGFVAIVGASVVASVGARVATVVGVGCISP